MDMTKMTAAQKLMIGYLHVNGVTQEELAATIGADPAQVSRWLTGRHNPCRAWQLQIARTLGNISKPRVGKMVRLRHVRKAGAA